MKQGEDIATNDPSDTTFLHSTLCQCHLPRKKTEERSFIRTDGSTSVRIDAGDLWDGEQWQPQLIPYGCKPRLIMLYLTTYAVRKQTRTVPIEDSLNGFLRRLNLDNNGGYSGNYTPFRQQLNYLAASRLMLGWKGRNRRPQTSSTQPIEHFDAWLANGDTQRSLWPGEITLSPTFYETLLEQSVPLDPRAIEAFSDSSLELDIYSWLAHRLHRLPKKGQAVYWSNLKSQFGNDYADIKNFKRDFKKSLTRARAAYPDARIESITGGIKLMPSPPPINKTNVMPIR